MKCKIFKGPDLAKVEKEINRWLTKEKVTVKSSSTAVGQIKVPGKNKKGKTVSKSVYYVVVTVIYE
jgi:hypothetical protein